MFSMIQTMPYAVANILGNAANPGIRGTVFFYETQGGHYNPTNQPHPQHAGRL